MGRNESSLSFYFAFVLPMVTKNFSREIQQKSTKGIKTVAVHAAMNVIRSYLCAVVFSLTIILLLYGSITYVIKIDRIAAGYSLNGQVSDVKEKKILVWTKIFGANFSFDYSMECAGVKEKCSVTVDKSLLSSSNAVVFHVADFNIESIPANRKYDQLYVFYTMEAPVNHDAMIIKTIPRNFFNWSMTYRKDSNVPTPYGGFWINPTIAKRVGAEPVRLETNRNLILSNKARAIVWFVSNCHTVSRRELAVQKLSKYIEVDVYGQCASSVSSKSFCSKNNRTCEAALFSGHYFYIAAENSICEDYITEKYWDRYHYPSIPIVLKRYVYERYLPSKSFIAMDDFKGAREMAFFLKNLMENNSAYMEYFEWRTEGWSKLYQFPGFRMSFCKLCEQLFVNVDRESVQNLKKWFYEESKCPKRQSQFAKNWLP